jgi:hypothetical protein
LPRQTVYAHLSFGPLADIAERLRDVRFTPQPGHPERRNR